MKRWIVILLALFMLGSVALGETATLRFSSFAGGGYEYSVEVDDPTIARCETKYEYGEQDEPVSGASFDFTATFTGLKPGSTCATVYGRSPLLENDDRIYTVSVDEDLNVTLVPEKKISTFFAARVSEIAYGSYKITMENGGYLLSINEEEAKPVNAGLVDALMESIDRYDVAAWDGFEGSPDDYILDGEEFWLEIGFTDGARVAARGDNVFPENYGSAMGDMWRILTWMAEEKDMKLTIAGTEVPVTWEDNESVAALKALLPLTIQMSMYGGFEQVGPIGQDIARDDAQTLTEPGDIMLYLGNQIVIFYGSNSWAYTKLGHVDLSPAEMTGLLGDGDVTIGISEE